MGFWDDIGKQLRAEGVAIVADLHEIKAHQTEMRKLQNAVQTQRWEDLKTSYSTFCDDVAKEVSWYVPPMTVHAISSYGTEQPPKLMTVHEVSSYVPSTEKTSSSSSGSGSSGVTTEIPGVFTVTASVLNVRSGGAVTFDIIGKLTRGASVTVTSWSNGWACIDYNNGIGWVKGSYLSGPAVTAEAIPETAQGLKSANKDALYTSYSLSTNYIDYSKDPSKNVMISSRDQYSQNGADPLTNFNTKAESSKPKMIVIVNNGGTPAVYNFEFIIGPTTTSEHRSNIVNPVRTGGGYFIYRGGPNLTRMTLSGLFLNSKEADERRVFLERYYKEHLIDKVNAFHEYFNESRLLLELNDYRYTCLLTDLELTRSQDSKFSFRYTMGLLITSSSPLTAIYTPTESNVKSTGLPYIRDEERVFTANVGSILTI